MKKLYQTPATELVHVQVEYICQAASPVKTADYTKTGDGDSSESISIGIGEDVSGESGITPSKGNDVWGYWDD